jgi:uracil-DNA glycosylase family 4
MNKCPGCGSKLIQPVIPPGSKVALVGTEPGRDEMSTGIPFIGPTGKILRGEFLRQGIDIGSMIRTNLWLHYYPKRIADREPCEDWHVEQLIKTIDGCRAVMLMGRYCTRRFLGVGTLEVTGTRVRIPEFGKGVITIASVNPAICLKGTMGEFRLAVERFIKIAEKYL